MTTPKSATDIHPKIAAASAVGALGTIVTWGLSALNVQLPPTVWVALVVVGSFVAGYFKKAK